MFGLKFSWNQLLFGSYHVCNERAFSQGIDNTVHPANNFFGSQRQPLNHLIGWKQKSAAAKNCIHTEPDADQGWVSYQAAELTSWLGRINCLVAVNQEAKHRAENSIRSHTILSAVYMTNTCVCVHRHPWACSPGFSLSPVIQLFSLHTVSHKSKCIRSVPRVTFSNLNLYSYHINKLKDKA